MRVGIITIHKSEVNYGACLQSFALWKYLSDQGHDCEIIDLLRPCHSDYKVSPSFGEKGKSWKQNVRKWVKSIFRKSDSHGYISSRCRKFAEFNNLAKYSRTFQSVEELYKAGLDYDIYVTGSDQVWNPKMPFLNDPYFLTFVPQDKKKVSYASSFGIDKIPQERKTEYARWLSQYDSLSTREESGARIVEELVGKRPGVVLDPVFLLKRSVWSTYMQEVPDMVPGEYIFVYMLKYDERIVAHARVLADRLQKPLYMVLSEEKIIDTPSVKQLVSIGPSEWLWMIANADTVVTSSFHGTAISIVLDTPFVALLQREAQTNSRILDMLSYMGLTENQFYIDQSSEEIFGSPLHKGNYKDCYSSMYTESCNYLTESISL